MKRTKQRFDKDNDEPPKFVSGCRKFDGEDVGNYLISPIHNLTLCL
jgi:hypothetical protein